jgi:hypothetical protein
MKHTLIRRLPIVDRRTTLRWLFAGLAAGQLAACGELGGEFSWSPPEALTGKGYGTDPDLLDPKTPWPLTLTAAELKTVGALVDLILPADGDWPSASAAGVPLFIDEWVSAPYPSQQEQRGLILPGLAWLDNEARKGGEPSFAEASLEVRRGILDRVAFKDRIPPELETAGRFFSRMRALTIGAYYTTAEGWKEIGYPGNRPASGPYEGPSSEAMSHLRSAVEAMGLTLVSG